MSTGLPELDRYLLTSIHLTTAIWFKSPANKQFILDQTNPFRCGWVASSDIQLSSPSCQALQWILDNSELTSLLLVIHFPLHCSPHRLKLLASIIESEKLYEHYPANSASESSHTAR